MEKERACAAQYVGTDGREIHWDFIRLALGSVARLAIFPLQDVLGLGTECRMNLPGMVQGNWEWRFTRDMLKPNIKEKLREFTQVYERCPVPQIPAPSRDTPSKPTRQSIHERK